MQQAGLRYCLCIVFCCLFCLGAIGAYAQQSPGTAPVQEALRNGVLPMGKWLEFRKVRYGSQPILIHLRTGYERALLMPEPVSLEDPNSTLPGCEIVIDDNIVAFYPTRIFKRQPVRFIGMESGLVYELRVKASTKGIRQPLEITR